MRHLNLGCTEFFSCSTLQRMC